MSNTLSRAISHANVEGPCATIEKPSGIIPVSVGQGGIEVDDNVVEGVPGSRFAPHGPTPD